ncbi:hypothetical protein MWN34_06845 [Ancylobacter sp. 6x-1]|uniref:Uncharacterized protein n=1 Tax=Ancylobacter crimeensis TaxID=2579147 RepID=A0ABT0D9K5_9HYPH|nr:hypothetical protein [Ancylobacter crimeensis]MCK0196630.1 hypothetical protein [Ancylobacter crimeensis]
MPTDPAPQPPSMASAAELDRRIADVRENMRVLTEQAAAYSGAGDENFTADRLAEQQELLDRLTAEREQLEG